MAKFNERLEIALQQRGWAQKDLAEALGIHKAMVSQYLSGRCQPNNIEKIIEIAKLLDVSAPWLAGYDTEEDDYDHVAVTRFRDRLNEALNIKNMTSNQLAAMIGYNEKNVSDWRRGNGRPDFDTILKISQAIGVSMIWLIGCDVPMLPNEASNHVLKMFEHLNEAGRRKVEDYINDLLDGHKYRKG